jgi:hypothetical protein
VSELSIHNFLNEAIMRIRKARRTREQLAELTASQGGKLFSCVDSFREDLTSRGLEENVYRV